MRCNFYLIFASIEFAFVCKSVSSLSLSLSECFVEKRCCSLHIHTIVICIIFTLKSVMRYNPVQSCWFALKVERTLSCQALFLFLFFVHLNWIELFSVFFLSFFSLTRNEIFNRESQSRINAHLGVHAFIEYTYKKITACDVCREILRGMYVCMCFCL